MKEPILEMRGITKKFGSVTANKDVDLTLYPGEIHALLGENGAGKSTLMNILNGIYKPNHGKIYYKGKKVSIRSPRHAVDMGIGMVHQHFRLIPTLTAAENVFLYMSYNREVDTYMLLSQCFMDGKKVYAPKVLSKTQMEFYCLSDENDLVSGYMGIMEPSDACEKADTRDGLFIMPGLAFDYDFHRIGYGGGFYDRYLSIDNTFIKAALAFDFQLLESIPYEEHDLKPDYIITQTQFIRRDN